jgi:heat shock protein HslJ
MRLFALTFLSLWLALFICCKSRDTGAAKTNVPLEDVVVKTPDDIKERKWFCVELNGKAPEVSRMFITFSDSSFGGRGACNSYGGQVKYNAPAGIRLLNIVSTEMACAGLGTEQEFFLALQSVDQFRLDGDTLTLLKAKSAPVVKLVVVKEP